MQTNHFVVTVAISLLYAKCASGFVCDVPGTTMQWVTDRCMLEHDRSDPNSEAVQECVRRSGAGPQPCELNRHYKRAYCEVLVKKGKYKGSIATCVGDPEVTGSYGKGGGV